MTGDAERRSACSPPRSRRGSCSLRRPRGAGRPPGRPRRRSVRLHEPAVAPRPARHRRRELERLRAVHLHLELAAAISRALHQRERQHQLARAGRRAELHRHFHALLRPAPLARRRGLLRPRGHRRAPALGSARHRRRDPELRAAEDRLGDAAALPLADVPPADVRLRRRARREDVRPDAARRRGRQPAARPHAGQLHHPRRLRPEQHHRGPAPDVPQHGVHDARLVGLRRRRARLLVRRHGGALLGRLGGRGSAA